MRKPLYNDKFSKIIDYNWIVDGILKNSMPYETQKETKPSMFSNKKRKRLDRYRLY
jgi:hypothetical protein